MCLPHRYIYIFTYAHGKFKLNHFAHPAGMAGSGISLIRWWFSSAWQMKPPERRLMLTKWGKSSWICQNHNNEMILRLFPFPFECMRNKDAQIWRVPWPMIPIKSVVFPPFFLFLVCFHKCWLTLCFGGFRLRRDFREPSIDDYDISDGLV